MYVFYDHEKKSVVGGEPFLLANSQVCNMLLLLHATTTTFIGHSSQATKIHGFQELQASHPALKWATAKTYPILQMDSFHTRNIANSQLPTPFSKPNLPTTMHWHRVAF